MTRPIQPNMENKISTHPIRKSANAYKGIFLAILAASLWGISGTFGQYVFQQKGINVEWLMSARMLISGSILLVYLFIKNPSEALSVWKNKKDTLRLLIFSITGMLAVQYTYFATIKLSNAATATVLQYAGPVLIAVYVSLKRKKIPQPLEILAILFAVLGTFLLVTHANLSTLAISPEALIMGIASAFALAMYTLQPVSLLEKYSSTAIVGWAMVLGGFACSFVKAPWNIEGNWDFSTYTSVAFIIIFGTLIAFYAYLTAVKMIGGQKSSLLATAEPLSATLIAVLWLQIPFTTMDYIGSACIISTIFILSAGKEKK